MESEIKEQVLQYGMVGGGEGAFIGEVHRKAIAMDGQAELICGCFSSDFDNTCRTGQKLGLQNDRLYEDFLKMAEEEGRRERKIDFVVIATPNNTHYPIAKAFLENGIHVVCDKPFTITSEQAADLRKLADKNSLQVCITYTYTGYPMAKHGREMIKCGELGEIRFINVEYPQEWLSTRLETTDHKQASWRGDPEKTGPANSLGDIGTHVENMVSFMTGLKIERLSARLDTLVSGRKLDDNVTVMVDYVGGAKGVYWCSQVAVGNDNGLRVRIFGEKGSLDWKQEDPDHMKVSSLDKPACVLSRGRDKLYPAAQYFSRIPAGHPEGVFEAFANIYRSFISCLQKMKNGGEFLCEDMDFPCAADGERGIVFIEKCLESSHNDSAWVNFQEHD